jgi:hypothetical protein
MRAEGLSLVHQTAAGAAPLTSPRFDAHLQRDTQQHPCASIGGITTNLPPLPNPNGYSQGNLQNESQYRYSLPASFGPSALPSFVSQKATDPLYNLQYPDGHSNANSAQPPRQSYPMGAADARSDEPHPRSGSSGSSAESGSGRWPAIYAMHPDDQRQASQLRSQQHVSTQPHCTPLGSDVRTNLFHLAATM